MISHVNRHANRQFVLVAAAQLFAGSAICWRRKGIQMLKKCAYCRETIEEGKEVKMTILIIQGSQLQPVERNYCSKQCGQYDQMANEA